MKGRSHVKCLYQTNKPETKNPTEEHKETCGGDGHVYYLGYGDGNRGVYVYMCIYMSKLTKLYTLCAVFNIPVMLQ